MTTRRKESIKLIILAIIPTIIFLVGFVIGIIKMVKYQNQCNTYEIQAKEYDNEWRKIKRDNRTK